MEKKVNTPIVITLEPWEYEWASHVGTRRYIENWGKSDAAYYDKSRMEDDRTAQVAACVAELSVAKYTNRYWSGHVWTAQEHGKYRGQTLKYGDFAHGTPPLCGARTWAKA
jgi:hypothetical protein